MAYKPRISFLKDDNDAEYAEVNFFDWEFDYVTPYSNYRHCFASEASHIVIEGKGVYRLEPETAEVNVNFKSRD